MPKKSLRNALKTLLISTLLSSCAKIEIPDIEVCSDAGVLGAFCVTSVSNKERDIEKTQWDKDRFGMLCMKSDAFADIKAAILKLCHDNKRCVLEVEKKSGEIDDKIKKMSAKGKNRMMLTPRLPDPTNG